MTDRREPVEQIFEYKRRLMSSLAKMGNHNTVAIATEEIRKLM
jgi:hypothetical protein